MKHLFSLVAALLLVFNSFAQAPILFNYQAVLRDNNGGALVTSRTVVVRVSILQGSANGPAVYVERHTPTTNINGLMTFDIGGGTVQTGALSSLAWSQGNYWLKVETDPLGTGISYTIVATSKLLSVPYAMYANQAGHYIGELFGGGIIFSLWRDHLGIEHGLIASLSDLGSYPWASSDITTAFSTRDGAANTAAILAALGPLATNTAAGICNAYTGGPNGAVTGWYLPSQTELTTLYNQSIAVNAVLENDNNPATTGLNGVAYWTSTYCLRLAGTNVDEAPNAVVIGFRENINPPFPNADPSVGFVRGPGQPLSSGQQASYSVRAIRRF